MKTSVIMNRSMGDLSVNQRTKDGMFNATSLLKQWNDNPNNPQRELKRFFEAKKTQEFLQTLKDDDDFLTGANLPYLKSKGRYGGTWMHPYLFIKFSMWINPKFELAVIKFVYDELIKTRHSAGDNYKLLSESGVKLKGYNFAEVATALNWIIFGKKGKELRQSASEEQLKELSDLQTKISFAIDMGYIGTYQKLLIELREVWRLKQEQTPF